MHKVLVTKELTNEQEALAHDYGLDVTQQPFIKIKFEYDTVEIPFADAWIVTSSNAARYINSHFDSFSKNALPEMIFAIGESSAEPIDHLGIPIKIPSYGTAENLADFILRIGIQSAVFFCGNRRRDTLPDLLEYKIDLHEFQVYQTELIDKKMNMDQFDGVAFFSPSGVQGFAQSNQITNQKVIAIGTTTKKEIKNTLGVDAGIPASPSMEDVLFALKQDLQ